jgi:hypothetical protein
MYAFYLLVLGFIIQSSLPIRIYFGRNLIPIIEAFLELSLCLRGKSDSRRTILLYPESCINTSTSLN